MQGEEPASPLCRLKGEEIGRFVIKLRENFSKVSFQSDLKDDEIKFCPRCGNPVTLKRLGKNKYYCAECGCRFLIIREAVLL